MANSTTTCNYSAPHYIVSGKLTPVISGSKDPFQYASSTCVTVAPDLTITIGTSTSTNTPQYINGFSYGDIIIGLILFLMFAGSFFGGILNRLIGIKVKRPNY